MNRARTYHCTRMRHCIEQSNGLVPSLLCPSWVDFIIATRGYDFRKGQAEPGAVFGELSVLLDQPHTADVLALDISQFHVADANTLLTQNPIAVLYVATMLAHRLDGANQALIQLKNQLQTGEPHSVVAKTVSKMEGTPRRQRRQPSLRAGPGNLHRTIGGVSA